jgi:RNA polymerase sigma-70 factor, ECF subfamily
MSPPGAAETPPIERLPIMVSATVPRSGAFEDIFRAHRGQVYALCLRLCGGDHMLADDALQETFLEVYKGLHGFRGESQLGTWIYRVAMRTTLRVRARHRPPIEAGFSPVGDAAMDAPGPHADAVARENARAVQAALDALPAEQLTVVALFAVDGLGHAAIAQILGIPEGTVWSRLHKARKALAAALK